MIENETISPQQRIAFERWVAALPDDELQALLMAWPVNGQVDLVAVMRDALGRLGLSPAAIEATIRAAAADPPDWRKSLH